jgi:anti-anti-sigma regulatory factor
MSLQWTVQQEGTGQRVVLRGDIDEVAPLETLGQQLGGAEVWLDVGGVERMNSGGVRQWLLFLRAMSGRGIAVRLERCRPVLLRQFHLVRGDQGGQIRSALAPYLCEPCDLRRDQLIDCTGDVAAQIAAAPRCERCGNAMEFDDLPHYYGAAASRSRR